MTLVGAPYDFRYTPDSPLGLDTNATIALIERAYEAAGNSKVTIISHSMGGLQTKYILEQVSEEWKQKFIRRWIPLSAPLIGAGNLWEGFASGLSLYHGVSANRTKHY